MRTTVWVRHEFIGFHMWPEAPEEVAYLALPHRHLFKVEVEVTVSHGNRQVEFHMLKQDVMTYCRVLEAQMSCEGTLGTVSWSCEHIANNILEYLDKYDVFKVIVSEDGECGATIYAD